MSEYTKDETEFLMNFCMLFGISIGIWIGFVTRYILGVSV